MSCIERCMVSLLLVVLWLPSLAWAITGPELALGLNQAYQSSTARCAGNKPAYFCSGVMLRQRPAQAPSLFWQHGPEATALGAERFSWQRHDVQGAQVSAASGYIFSNRFEAIAQGKDYSLQGDDGSSRPEELLVVNWDTSQPARLAVVAVYYKRGDMLGLRAAQKDQRDYFEATGAWLALLRVDAALPAGQVFGFDQREQLYTGYQVADRLNQRYADTAPSCVDGSPSYNCNGVLIRATSAAPSFHSWNPTSNSISRDGVSWTYVRADTGILRLASDAPGLIFDRLDQPYTHSVRLRCAYPANAGTSGIANSCLASCLSQGIRTVQDWRNRYGSSGPGGCSFRMEPTPNAAQFQVNTVLRSSGGAHNEIIIGAWPQNIPAQLPLEAIYLPHTGGSLAGAQYIQWDYFKATGKHMPVVRVNLGGGGQVFSYLPADQYLQEGAPILPMSVGAPQGETPTY